jgi:type IV pilus assembly protein PilV
MTRRRSHHARAAAGRGFGLIEAMVSVLLLSLCALAYAALQVRGLSVNASAMWRSKAALLSYEMADRMRANRAGLTGGGYNALTTPTAVTDCGGASSCAPARLALLDYYQWSIAAGVQLPGGSGVVCLDSTPDDGTASAPACDGVGTAYAVKLFWTERGTDSRLTLAVRP